MTNIRLLAIVFLVSTAAACKIDSLPPRANHDSAVGFGVDASKDSRASIDTEGTDSSQADSNSAIAQDLGSDVPMDSGAGLAIGAGGSSVMDGFSSTGGDGATDAPLDRGGAGGLDAFPSPGGAGGADATLGTGGTTRTDGGPPVADASITTVDTRGADAPPDAPIGGSIGTGGTTATGGVTGSGGNTSTGGTATGGTMTTGGTTGSGGVTSTGGTVTTGGTTASGGTSGGGAGGGTDATVDGGTSCAWANNVGSWSDEFSSSALDPSWNVWQYTGQRKNGQSTGMDHYSLTDNPGSLRYYVDPMVSPAHWHNYEPYYSGYYWYDPSLELSRELAGTQWTLDLKVTWYVEPTANAANHLLILHFDSASGDAWDYDLQRVVNSGTNGNGIALCAGPCAGNPVTCSGSAETTATIVQYAQFVRSDLTVTIRLSSDGNNWEDAL